MAAKLMLRVGPVAVALVLILAAGLAEAAGTDGKEDKRVLDNFVQLFTKFLNMQDAMNGGTAPPLSPAQDAGGKQLATSTAQPLADAREGTTAQPLADAREGTTAQPPGSPAAAESIEEAVPEASANARAAAENANVAEAKGTDGVSSAEEGGERATAVQIGRQKNSGENEKASHKARGSQAENDNNALTRDAAVPSEAGATTAVKPKAAPTATPKAKPKTKAKSSLANSENHSASNEGVHEGSNAQEQDAAAFSSMISEQWGSHELCSHLNLTAVRFSLENKEGGNLKLEEQASHAAEKGKGLVEHLMVLTGGPSNCVMKPAEIAELEIAVRSVLPIHSDETVARHSKTQAKTRLLTGDISTVRGLASTDCCKDAEALTLLDLLLRKDGDCNCGGGGGDANGAGKNTPPTSANSEQKPQSTGEESSEGKGGGDAESAPTHHLQETPASSEPTASKAKLRKREYPTKAEPAGDAKPPEKTAAAATEPEDTKSDLKHKADPPAMEKCLLFTMQRMTDALDVKIFHDCAMQIDVSDWNGITELLNSIRAGSVASEH